MIMENLHTLSLIKDAYEKVQELNFERYINELDKVSLYVKNFAFNQVLEKLGLHLMRNLPMKHLSIALWVNGVL
jgi:hypothetical protein